MEETKGCRLLHRRINRLAGQQLEQVIGSKW